MRTNNHLFDNVSFVKLRPTLFTGQLQSFLLGHLRVFSLKFLRACAQVLVVNVLETLGALCLEWLQLD
jgi:hypothetical protein